MNMTDPIADMLTRIRNGVQARKETVEIPASKTKLEIAKILKSEGYIINYAVTGESAAEKKITVTLKYGPNDEKVISGIKRISKPGLRVYAKYDALPRVLNGLGIAIISTSNGMMTDKEARAKHAGGEVVAYVW
ncbi:MAG: 30S ribosomal protein S8 [Erysipelotrichaceae bacterium]|nr:30S ribosomal protein S8 [Erysipelotrichaceae bacterium]